MADTPTTSRNDVNEHFVGHLAAVADTHDIEASEDIVSQNGVKLLAKGARIDHGLKDRLLQHKLRKPLEDCVRVVDGVSAQSLGEVIDTVLARHAFVASLWQRGAPPRPMFARLVPSLPLQSMLTVYGAHRPGKLEHAVLVALLAAGLMRALRPGDADGPPKLAMAGLFHDIGELYIDPEHLGVSGRLELTQWKQIATHPITAHRVLREIEGGQADVANAILHHHERLDGYGYPQGACGERVPLDGQILGAAELLGCLLESGAGALTRASIAMRLIPGEFGRALIDIVATAQRGDAAPAVDEEALARAQKRVIRIAGTLAGFRAEGATISRLAASASPALRAVVEQSAERLHRIQLAFSSTGLDAPTAEAAVARLDAIEDAASQAEVMVVLRELAWRLDELERETLLRAERAAPAELESLRDIVMRLKAAGVQAVDGVAVGAV